MIGIVGIEADCGLGWVFRLHAFAEVDEMHPSARPQKKPGTLGLPGIKALNGRVLEFS